jgi:hypothetical protein
MKKLILLACLLFPIISFGQNYSIDWYKVGGGGGTSTGSVYSVSGTIGQPDASGAMTGPMNGTNYYSVTGGFWAIYAVQTPGAPLLTITHVGNQTIVSWPSPSTGFLLQTNGNLGTANWVNYGGIIGDNGIIKTVTNAPSTGNLFFRLKQ